MFGAPEPLGGEGQMETRLHAFEEKVTRAPSLGLVLSGTVALGGPVGAFEVQP